jgi:hypothetical protein
VNLTENLRPAYRSSQYLQSLLQHDIIVPEPSEALDNVYKQPSAKSAPPDLDSSPSASANTSSPTGAEHEILLTREAVPDVLKTFDIAEGSTGGADLYRAVEQARLRVESGRLGL